MRFVALYTPASFVDSVFTTPVSTFVTLTVAPGSTAPLESPTVPVIVAKTACAAALVPGTDRPMRRKTRPRNAAELLADLIHASYAKSSLFEIYIIGHIVGCIQ